MSVKIRGVNATRLHVPIPEELDIPERPGLGITIDESFVRRYAVTS